MTTEADDLVSTLGSVFSNKFDPQVVKAGTLPPYAIYTLISGIPEMTVDGATPNLSNLHWQVDIFGNDKAVVDALTEGAIAALLASPYFRVGSISKQDIYEDAVRYYRVSLDFSTWRQT